MISCTELTEPVWKVLMYRMSVWMNLKKARFTFRVGNLALFISRKKFIALTAEACDLRHRFNAFICVGDDKSQFINPTSNPVHTATNSGSSPQVDELS
ncbi:hypothetical protein AVEN_243456-1 [Araneus ventricosus]|uniref:Uncharacterized protein n=1 Tax=Araneus ventricosus TaxID=182803 RepID=A0A4Y2RVM1_ARAVE|nr:hypothetical protein AVEN_243456-1 [Araneus ventricosus]